MWGWHKNEEKGWRGKYIQWKLIVFYYFSLRDYYWISWISHLYSRVIRPSIVDTQKQPPRGVPWKSCSENMQQIYTRTPIPKCDFQNTFLKNTSGWMLLNTLPTVICSISCLKGSITPYSMNIFSNFTFHKKTYLLACCLKMKNEIICSSFSQY